MRWDNGAGRSSRFRDTPSGNCSPGGWGDYGSESAPMMRPVCYPASLRSLLLMLLLRVNKPGGEAAIRGVGEVYSLRQLRSTLRPGSLSDLSKFLKDLGSQIQKARDRLTNLKDLIADVDCEYAADLFEISVSVHECLSVAATLLSRVCVCLETPGNLATLDELPEIPREALETEFVLKHATSDEWISNIGFDLKDVVWARANLAPSASRGIVTGDEIRSVSSTRAEDRGGSSGVISGSSKVLKQKLVLESDRQEKLLGQLVVDYLRFWTERPLGKSANRSKGRDHNHAALAAVVWDNRALGHSLEAGYLQEMVAVEQDLTALRNIQQQLATEVRGQQEPLDNAEENVAHGAMFTRQAADELLAAAGSQAQNWTWSMGGFGAVAGGVMGLIGGPPGAAIGASVGGALGGMAGRFLKARRRAQLRLVRANLHGPPFRVVPLAESANTQWVATDSSMLPSQTTTGDNAQCTQVCRRRMPGVGGIPVGITFKNPKQ